MDSAGSPPGQLHLYLEARAGRPVSSCRWGLGPARFGSYRKPMGVLGVLPYLPPVAYDASGLGSCDSCHRLFFE
jgi:hypothetical protein